jgi:hypothetical protein
MPSGAHASRWSVLATAVALVGCLAAGIVVAATHDSATATAKVTEHGVPISGDVVTQADVTRLLAIRSAAVRDHDERAFLATVDPTQPRLVASQRLLFRNLIQFDYTRFALSSDGEGIPLRTSIGWNATPLFVYQTQQIQGFDDRPSNRFYLAKTTVVRHHLVLDPADKLDPTATTRLVVVRRPHVLVAIDYADRAAATRLADAAEAAASSAGNYWAPNWQHKFVLFATHNAHTFDKVWYGGSLGPNFTGYATLAAGLSRNGGIDPKHGDSRVVLDLARTGHSLVDLVATLRHEFTHAASSAITKPATPTWVVEGYAELTQFAGVSIVGINLMDNERQSMLRTGDRTLPPGLQNQFGDPFYFSHVGRNYARAFLAMRAIADIYGVDHARQFYIAAQGGGRALTRAWASLGTTQAGFDREFGRWLRAPQPRQP